MLTRRRFLENTLSLSAGLTLVPSTRIVAYASNPPITPRLANAAPVRVPSNFVGLGYEMSSVASPGLLSHDNHRYVALIKGLGSAGVLRVGGIVADYTRYEPSGT